MPPVAAVRDQAGEDEGEERALATLEAPPELRMTGAAEGEDPGAARKPGVLEGGAPFATRSGSGTEAAELELEAGGVRPPVHATAVDGDGLLLASDDGAAQTAAERAPGEGIETVLVDRVGGPGRGMATALEGPPRPRWDPRPAR